MVGNPPAPARDNPMRTFTAVILHTRESAAFDVRRIEAVNLREAKEMFRDTECTVLLEQVFDCDEDAITAAFDVVGEGC